MLIEGKPQRTIGVADDGCSVAIIDQTRLPHEVLRVALRTVEDAARAIETMQVRGAPLIGGTAAYGICLAMQEDASDEARDRAYARLIRTRPTAVNLRWALDEMRAALRNRPRGERPAAARARAAAICDEDVAICRAIVQAHGGRMHGEHRIVDGRVAGARFVITLPRGEPPQDDGSQAAVLPDNAMP